MLSVTDEIIACITSLLTLVVARVLDHYLPSIPTVRRRQSKPSAGSPSMAATKSDDE